MELADIKLMRFSCNHLLFQFLNLLTSIIINMFNLIFIKNYFDFDCLKFDLLEYIRFSNYFIRFMDLFKGMLNYCL